MQQCTDLDNYTHIIQYFNISYLPYLCVLKINYISIKILICLLIIEILIFKKLYSVYSPQSMCNIMYTYTVINIFPRNYKLIKMSKLITKK